MTEEIKLFALLSSPSSTATEANDTFCCCRCCCWRCCCCCCCWWCFFRWLNTKFCSKRSRSSRSACSLALAVASLCSARRNWLISLKPLRCAWCFIFVVFKPCFKRDMTLRRCSFGKALFFFLDVDWSRLDLTTQASNAANTRESCDFVRNFVAVLIGLSATNSKSSPSSRSSSLASLSLSSSDNSINVVDALFALFVAALGSISCFFSGSCCSSCKPYSISSSPSSFSKDAIDSRVCAVASSTACLKAVLWSRLLFPTWACLRDIIFSNSDDLEMVDSFSNPSVFKLSLGTESKDRSAWLAAILDCADSPSLPDNTAEEEEECWPATNTGGKGSWHWASLAVLAAFSVASFAACSATCSAVCSMSSSSSFVSLFARSFSFASSSFFNFFVHSFSYVDQARSNALAAALAMSGDNLILPFLTTMAGTVESQTTSNNILARDTNRAAMLSVTMVVSTMDDADDEVDKPAAPPNGVCITG